MGTALKLGAFVTVMLILTGALFVIFGQYRSGPSCGYSAVFTDVSSLKRGDSVRVSGIRVGTVNDVALQPDNTVVVEFDASPDVVLTTGTTAAVRYLNLVGTGISNSSTGPARPRYSRREHRFHASAPNPRWIWTCCSVG